MKKTLKICILLFICLSILFIGTEVMAATASITVDPESVTVGDTVTATVKYTAAAWNLKVTADSGLTTSSTTQYADSTDSAANESKSFTVKYTASKAGNLYIYLKGDVTDEASNTADTVSQKIKVSVKEKPTTTDKKENDDKTTTDKKDEETTTTEKTKEKSNNAYLKTLGVRIKDSLAKELGVKTDEYDFSGFSKTKTSYSVTVPKNVDSLKVVTKTADSNATVKVTGNSGFEVGSNNKITIKVTAEDGKTTKTYTIKVTQLAEEEEKPGNLIEEEGVYLTSLSIDALELSPEFAKDTYSYTAKLTNSEETELKVNAVANDEKVNIDISGNTELVEGENTINIVLTLDGSTEQTVYQIVVTKEVAEVPTITTSEHTPSSTTDFMGAIKGYIGIAIAVIVFMIVAVIVLVILLRRENKRLNEDKEYDEDIEETKTEEYNVYKNDENEFMNNDMKKDNFIESLYKQRNGNFDEEELSEQEKETLEEISRQTEEIFREKVEGQSVEYSKEEFEVENPLEVRRKRRGKGKHSL